MNDRGHLDVELPAAGAVPASGAATGLRKLEIGNSTTGTSFRRKSRSAP